MDEQVNKLEKLQDEKGITEKVNNEMNEETEENIEIPLEELKMNKKKKVLNT